MTIKQFLKPTVKKIILIFVIGFIGLFSLYFSGFCSMSMCLVDYVIMPSHFLNFPLEIYLSLSYNLGNKSEASSLDIMLGFGINVVYWYLLSCFIVWIYDKFRKVKRK